MNFMQIVAIQGNFLPPKLPISILKLGISYAYLRHKLLNKKCSIFIRGMNKVVKCFRKLPTWAWQAFKVRGDRVNIKEKLAKSPPASLEPASLRIQSTRFSPLRQGNFLMQYGLKLKVILFKSHFESLFILSPFIFDGDIHSKLFNVLIFQHP